MFSLGTWKSEVYGLQGSLSQWLNNVIEDSFPPSTLDLQHHLTGLEV